jgi:K+-transporting ATPase ATPase A chain
MLTNANLQVGLFAVALLILVKPLGLYMALAADGKAPLLSRIGGPFEKLILPNRRHRPR